MSIIAQFSTYVKYMIANGINFRLMDEKTLSQKYSLKLSKVRTFLFLAIDLSPVL